MPQQSPEPKPEGEGAAAASSRRADIGRNVRTIAYVALAVFVTIFLLRNAQTVEVDFVLGSVEVPMFVVLIVTLMLGAVLALGAQGLRHRRKAKRARSAPQHKPQQPRAEDR